jgi:NitT/TauT family transport system substrate-binding protein
MPHRGRPAVGAYSWGIRLCVMWLVLVGLAGPASAGDKATFRMNWYWRGIQAPFAFAAARGYFEQAGIDMELLEGRGSAITVQAVGAKADTFGFVDGFTLMLSVTRGVPIRAVATVLGVSSFALVSLEEAGIQAARDLEGRTLGVTPGDGHTQVWPAVIAANRLRPESIRLVHMDPKAKMSALTQRQVDAVLGSAADIPVTLGLRGIRTKVLTFAEMGVSTVGFTIAAHEDTIRDKPELVRRVVAASVRGVEEAAREPEPAVQALARIAPLVDITVARQQLAVDLSFLFSPANGRRRVGYSPPEDWEAMLEILKAHRAIETSVPASAFYTNAFLP